MKLEAIGPEEKDKELDVLHLEHVTYTPAPPGPKSEGTDPSVHTWISDGGREDRSSLEPIKQFEAVCLKQFGVGLHCCLCSRE